MHEQAHTCGVDTWRYVWYGTDMYANIQQKSVLCIVWARSGHKDALDELLWQWLSAAQYATHFTGKQAKSVTEHE